MNGDILAVNEIYGITFQGEGMNLGMPCFFLRLAGCNLACSWCFIAGTQVLMSDWTQKPIEDIKPGDSIMSYGERGYKISRVTNITQRTEKTVQVNTSKGHVITTPDHVFHVNHHKSGRRKAAAMNLRGLYIKRSKLGHYQRARVSDEYLRGYLQGAYIGDGNISQWKQYDKLFFQITDIDFAERLEFILNRFGKNVSVGRSSRLTNRGKVVYRLSCTLSGIEWITQLPDNSEEWRGFIAGFFDAEGSAGKNQVSVSQKDEKWLYRLQGVLLDRFAIKSTLQQREVSSLTINGSEQVDKFFAYFDPAIQRKVNKFTGNMNRQLESVLVESVNELSDQVVYNIETSIGNFFANGFLVDNCDTRYAWDWTQYDSRQEMHPMTVDQVFDKLVGMAVHYPNGRNLVISGGEPMLQQKALYQLTKRLHEAKWHTEIETAGTIPPLSTEIVKHWTVSPKLTTSHNKRATIIPEALARLNMAPSRCFKFVVTAVSDYDEIDGLVAAFGLKPVYIMPEGTAEPQLTQHLQAITEGALQRGYNLTTRLHITLYGKRRGI